MTIITGKVKSNQPNKWPHQQISIWPSQMSFQNHFTAKDLEKLTTWIQDSKFFSFSVTDGQQMLNSVIWVNKSMLPSTLLLLSVLVMKLIWKSCVRQLLNFNSNQPKLKSQMSNRSMIFFVKFQKFSSTFVESRNE